MTDLVWLIPALPLAGFGVLLVAGRRLGEPLAGWVATLATAASFVATTVVWLGLLDRPAEERRVVQTLFTWVAAGRFEVDVGFLADPLSITMALFVTGVGTLIHLYSIGYMHGDEDFPRFFVYLNLFVFAMLMLVLGDNLLLTFLGWEGVGACSYLLISFWFTDPANASAGKKAFLTNRVGDWGFMVAMFLAFGAVGSVRYVDLFGHAGTLATTTATAIVVLLFLGATGKSAQIPLFLWLPDAMAGPTPVSALIHAATMVTSGVYLLVRVNPLIAEAADWAPSLVAWVGVITALVAATIAIAQNDIKKVLAYSTISQLGYMVLAVGTGAYVAAIFHMVTHAFFKALLFLGAGSVIHGMNGEQDMRRYGGLWRFMPVTAATFIVGWLAIAGVPPFAGFWSKDEILAFAYDDSPALWAIGLVTAVLTAFYMSRQVFMTFFGRYRYADVTVDEIAAAWDAKLTRAGEAASAAEAEVAAAEEAMAAAIDKRDKAAAKVADRSAELEAVDEDGREKAEKNLAKARAALEKAEAAVTAAGEAVDEARAAAGSARADIERVATAAEAGLQIEVGLDAPPALGQLDPDELPDEVRARREYHPHESPWTMTVPLVALAGLAVVGGALNLPFSSDVKFLEHWLEPALFGHEVALTVSGAGQWTLAAVSVVGGLIGIVVAASAYLRFRPPPRVFERRILAHGWYYDEAVTAFMGGPGRRLFDGIATVDAVVVDGAVNGVARLVRLTGGRLRRLQTGLVRSYAVGVGGGAVALLVWFLVRSSL
ncbi:MAG: NADH-quinone oxidoreductase subunit L [Actinomyces sp.]|nr:MAG: NADH-quinone oxidoreductase subunit L [Actinomyces sp.]